MTVPDNTHGSFFTERVRNQTVDASPRVGKTAAHGNKTKIMVEPTTTKLRISSQGSISNALGSKWSATGGFGVVFDMLYQN